MERALYLAKTVGFRKCDTTTPSEITQKTETKRTYVMYTTLQSEFLSDISQTLPDPDTDPKSMKPEPNSTGTGQIPSTNPQKSFASALGRQCSPEPQDKTKHINPAIPPGAVHIVKSSTPVMYP